MKAQKNIYFSGLVWVALPFVAAAIAILMLIFAPNQLHQWGSSVAKKVGKNSFTLATASKRGHYFSLGGLIRDEMKLRFKVDLDLLVTHGSLDNIQMIQAGQADFGLIQSGMPGDLNGLVGVANLGQQYVHIVVPMDSPIQSFSDLAGSKINVGEPTSGFAALADRILQDFPFSPSLALDYRELVTTETIEAAFADGSVDAIFTVFQLHAPLMEDLLRDGHFRLVPIEHAPSLAFYLPGSRAVTLPFGIYGPNRSIPADSFPTLAVDTLLVTRRNMNGAIVQNLLETIYSNSFIKRSKLVDLDEDLGRRVFDPPLHPAAERFYGRNDPVSADTFEIASFFIAALVFAGSLYSGLSRASRTRKMARSRKQIEPYFEALIAFSDNVSKTSKPRVLEDEMLSMMTTNREAERLWLAGKLDTEHMENLYTIYGVRSANALNKLMLLHITHQGQLLEQLVEEVCKNKDREPET